MNVDQLVESLLRDAEFASGIAEYRRIPGREAHLVPYPEGIDGKLIAALERHGIRQLYAHQREAIDHTLAGRNVAVVTPTASGKTLCYNLPVVNSMLHDPNARALYIFPTKALSQDQLSELKDLTGAVDADIKSFTYDGDTPADARRSVRQAGNIVITNPDMLHTGILPHHTRWVRLFENLQYVVLDELHTYRGVFGSHVANLLRRLMRICAHYGTEPRFICCSATIGNPAELAVQLLERSVELVDNNGAPAGAKHIVLYNPPFVDRQLGIRGSSILTARRLAGRLLSNSVQTIVFGRSRTTVELLLTYLRADAKPGIREKIFGYRGGYLPQERRAIEQGLRTGSVLGVVSTNALELGIDIGGLDACVITGYPGTIASTRQQMGRAGRSADSSLAIMVAGSNPLDQYISTHPEYVFEASPEHALVNPNNLHVLMSHIKCAAFELPFSDDDPFGKADSPSAFLEYLGQSGLLHHVEQRWHWMSESFPAEEISLRSASTDNVVIVEISQAARVIGEIDRTSAPMFVHEEAIYFHGGAQYQVERLDLEEKKAYVRRVDVDYYTDAELAVRIGVMECYKSDKHGRSHGEVSVTYLPTIFKKIKLDTHENVGWGKIHLPEDTMHTTCYWISLPRYIYEGMPNSELEAGLTGMANILSNLAPIYLMCERGDLRASPQIRAPFTDAPTIFLYDSIPGGVGFSARLYDIHDTLLSGALRATATCSCESGCPSCVGPQFAGGPNAKLHTIRLLDALIKNPRMQTATA
jgi:DEAD/DEAH box helicase domain-containing protein